MKRKPTLVEWLVIVALLGLLVALLMPVFRTARKIPSLASQEAEQHKGYAMMDSFAGSGMSAPTQSAPSPPAAMVPGGPMSAGGAMMVQPGTGAPPAEAPASERAERFRLYTQAAPQLQSPMSKAKVAPSQPPRHIAALPASPQLNPNMYISNTYMGGSGMKDRLEKLISEGVLVEGKRVKLEAFSRNYAQAFPIPTKTALNLVADTERAKIVQDGARTYLQVGLQAIKGEAPRRPLLNIAVVLDRSGSMGSENKLEFAKRAAAELVDKLHSTDIFSLIVFDSTAQLLIPAQKVGNKEKVKKVIASLVTGGGTNIYEGLQTGYREAHKNAGRDGVNLVILLSDGQVTAGVTDSMEFYRLAAANVDRDIQTTTVGVGVEFNEDLMLSIAREGKGNYHFIKDGVDTQKVFAQELDELTHIVAKALKLRVRLADGVGLVRVLGATQLSAEQVKQVKAEEKKIDKKVYEELGIARNRQKDKDESGIKVLIPNFYRGDSHVVMMEIAVPKGRGTRQVADVFLKYKDLVFKANREVKAAVTVDYTDDRAEMIASINRNVKKNLLGFQTGEALMDAAALIEQGRIAEAVKKIDERMTVLGLAAKEWRDKDLDRDGKLLDRYKTVIAQLKQSPHLAGGEFGQYLKKSLTYAGYQMTR